MTATTNIDISKIDYIVVNAETGVSEINCTDGTFGQVDDDTLEAVVEDPDFSDFLRFESGDRIVWVRWGVERVQVNMNTEFTELIFTEADGDEQKFLLPTKCDVRFDYFDLVTEMREFFV